MSFRMIDGKSPEEHRQRQLLQSALDGAKGTGRTAMSLRAGLYENAMRGGLVQDKMVQDQRQFDASHELDRDRLSQQSTQFDQELGMKRQALGVEALSGLRSGLATPRPVGSLGDGLGAMPVTRVTRRGSTFSDTSGVYEDEVDPLERKNGGVIGNVDEDDGSDKVPVVAREGEYYINPETVAHIGGGDYKQGLRSLNALVREATGKEPGSAPVGKSGLRGFAAGGSVKRRLAKLEDISAEVSQRAGQQAPINRADIATTVNVEPTQARAEAPKRGLIQGAKGAGGRALAFLSSPAVVGASLMAHSGDAGDQNEDAWATQQRANWGKPLAEGDEPWNNPLPYDTPITANAAREQAGATQAVRSQADEYSDSPERAAWQASLGDGTARQPDTADAFRTRNAAADVYRREWQRQSPGGLRNANPQALDTYNAEQQTRGTGISAQRQANGVMEFSGSGPAPKAQYLDASGNPTNEWQDTSQYRDAVVRSLGSNDPAMQQRGLAQAMQLQQRNQRGVSTGNPEMDQLLGQMEPREAAAVYRALNGGQGADGKGPKAPSLNDQRAVAGIVSGGNGDELMAGSINNRTAFADRAQQAGVNPEVVAGIANEPLSQDQLGRNVEIARVQNALVERANAPWTDAVEGGGFGAGLGVLGSLALRLAGNRVPGLKAAAEWAKANPTVLTRILAGAGAIGGTARGLDRQVTGDPKNMKWNEFQTTFRNGIPENAVKMDEKTGKVSILKDDGSAVSFNFEDLQRQGLLADFANMITLGMVGGNKDFSENVRTLRGLSVAQPR